jgi:hypothetical protein
LMLTPIASEPTSCQISMPESSGRFIEPTRRRAADIATNPAPANAAVHTLTVPRSSTTFRYQALAMLCGVAVDSRTHSSLIGPAPPPPTKPRWRPPSNAAIHASSCADSAGAPAPAPTSTEEPPKAYPSKTSSAAPNASLPARTTTPSPLFDIHRSILVERPPRGCRHTAIPAPDARDAGPAVRSHPAHGTGTVSADAISPTASNSRQEMTSRRLTVDPARRCPAGGTSSDRSQAPNRSIGVQATVPNLRRRGGRRRDPLDVRLGEHIGETVYPTVHLRSHPHHRAMAPGRMPGAWRPNLLATERRRIMGAAARMIQRQSG